MKLISEVMSGTVSYAYSISDDIDFSLRKAPRNHLSTGLGKLGMVCMKLTTGQR